MTEKYPHPIFRHYLEEEGDKPYFTQNSLAFYYEDMSRKQKLIEDLAKSIAGYDITMTESLSSIEKRVADYVNAWDGQVDQLPNTVNDLLTDWVKDGTVDTIIEDARLNLKADKAEVNELTVKLADKVEKDAPGIITYAMAAQDFREQITGGNTAVVGVDAVLEENIVNGAVSPDKTNFFRVGKNLFDKSKVTAGRAVNEVYGTTFANASYSASDYIEVLPSTTYMSGNSLYLAYYDANKSFISGQGLAGDGTAARTLTTPANAKYVRVTVFNSRINTYQLEKGSVQTAFEEYKRFIPQENIEEVPFDVAKIPAASIDRTQANFFELGKNLFNKAVVTVDRYINWDNGNLATNSTYVSSDFIKIEPSQVYSRNKYVRSVGFYNAEKIFISGVDSPAVTFTTPANAAYMRLSPYKTDLDIFQVEKGSVVTPFEPYAYKMDNNLLKNPVSTGKVLLFLPAEICVAVGRTIELYNNQVAWCGNINNYHFKWDCAIGKSMKRKFTVTGVSGLIGERALALTVYDNDMNVVATASTILKVVSSTIETPVSLLTIGDSLTNSKAWLGELRTLTGSQLTNVGTRGATNKHEGRSGFSANSYLSAATYSFEGEGIHPFWDGTRFNWNHYKTQTGINPNAVQIFLGTNGMTLDPTVNAGNIKKIVDFIRQDDATIPIFVVHTLYRGNQNGMGNEISSDGYAGNKGAWKLEEDRKVYNLMVRLNDLLKSYSNLHFVPIALAHDSENNFGAVSTPVNPRATQMELIPSEATHPQLQGYQQFADIMFSSLAKVF